MASAYMLDTDIASYIIRGTDAALLRCFASKINRVCVSSITVAELKFGAAKRQSAPLTQKIDAFCDLVKIVDFSKKSAQKYGLLRASLESAGTPLASMDLLIAATALAEGAILVTNNTAHFAKVQGLKLENWSERT